MKEEQKKRQKKIVLFPGVVDKLVGKGMEALKEKQFVTALSYFTQALQIEPNHPQGRFGVALSLIEQSRLEEAKDVTKNMLNEDIGNFYDVLQVHISLLVQLGQYDEVVTILEGIMSEERLPANMAESFYHLLHFSRQMVEDGTTLEIADEHQEPPEELLQMLNEESIEKQWLAIQMLGKMANRVFFEAVKDCLKNKKFDPVLKSIILQFLKEKNIAETIEIHKFGKVVKLHTTELESVFHEKFGKNTLAVVAEQLENHNPSLFEMASQMWWHYLFVIYPIVPKPLNPNLWAAAIHKTAAEMTGLEEDDLQLAKLYQVNLEQLLECSQRMMKIEQEAFNSQHR